MIIRTPIKLSVFFTLMLFASQSLSAGFPMILTCDSFDGFVRQNSLHVPDQTFQRLPSFDKGEDDEFLSLDEYLFDNGYNEQDVLLGRGGHNIAHPGNQRYLELIRANRSVYQSLSKKQYKSELAQEILDLLKEEEVRFMALDELSQCWFEVEDKRALQKISQCLRENNHKP